MKKVLSLVLVIAMVLSSMSFAFAGTFSDTADSDYEKAIETLAALGVLSGYPDGTFGAGRTITRAELAKVLVEALGYGELVAGASSAFPDTANHWAKGYVAIAAGTGLVLGYPDGTFRPENPVTFDETYTMVIRALGYTDKVLSGTWPTNYKVKAIDLDLNDNVVMAKTQADRGAVAQIFYNTLEKALVEIDEDGIAVDTGKDFIDNIATPDKSFDVTPDTVDPESKKYASEVVDLAPYMYQNLSVYLNDDDQVVYVKGSNNLVLSGVLNHANDLTDDVVIVYNKPADKNYTFNIVTSSAFMVNGVETVQDDAEYNSEDVKVTVVLDAADDDKLVSGLYDIVGVVAEKQTRAAQIDDVYVTGKSRIDVFTLPENDDDEVDLDNIVVTGAVDSLEDIEKDDVVVEYKAPDSSKTKLVVSRETVEGKVSRVDATGTATKYYINGKSYTKNGIATVPSLTLGTEGTFFLDHNGDIVAFEGQSGPTEYAVVLGIENGKTADKFGSVSIKDYPQIKLVNADNEEVVYDVYVKLGSDKKVSESVKIGSTEVFKDGLVKGADSPLSADEFTALETSNALIKYSVDKDGRIDAITVIGGSATFADEDDSKLVFADNAVIFDGRDGEDFAVVSEERLQFPVTARDIAYNDDGEIEAMVTSNVKAGATATYAYIDKVNEAYNADGDKVQLVVAYLNGAKVEYLTDGNYFTVGEVAANAVYALDLEGEVITGRTLATTTTAITVSAISTATNSITEVVDGVATRYFLTDDATILENSGTDNETEDILDIYDIKGATVTLYLNVDGEVVFIVK